MAGAVGGGRGNVEPDDEDPGRLRLDHRGVAEVLADPKCSLWREVLPDLAQFQCPLAALEPVGDADVGRFVRGVVDRQANSVVATGGRRAGVGAAQQAVEGQEQGAGALEFFFFGFSLLFFAFFPVFRFASSSASAVKSAAGGETGSARADGAIVARASETTRAITARGDDIPG